MPDSPEANIATADALTLLLHNQHAIATAIEELSLWVRAQGEPVVHLNVRTALQTLDANASAITAVILKLRQ
ncbi:hypothetical protein SAMN05216598_5560 [Pseudomonas asplenii]|uniref:Uncharacterized protein n=1 Tax=Pseudomonas asplenii TaxID=53407 RepID=A0A1H2A5F7_9PSED|nr:hypothetical protein [Pseudomonas asplenii]SDT41231.1 hypothetical protein SAMN05216598_5560 [Pseudomonas asplenii]